MCFNRNWYQKLNNAAIPTANRTMDFLEKVFIFFLTICTGVLYAQVEERGAGILRSRSSEQLKTGQTFAFVIGISDYKDPAITDLQFAHLDALAFYQYLKSPDGAGLEESNIKLLINQQATLAAIDNGLDWCRNTIKKGDRLLIYFAGHGDVEKQTLWQLGYLLAYDTPNGNYRNNATRLEDINNLVKTLTVADTLESKVIVIMDACRSGKLIGSDSRGASLTSDQLSKNVANEVRILSCKPDQNSMESKYWGGGRGLFSYHLVNGLYGAADESHDKLVSLEEIEDYLKKKIKESIENLNLTNKQNPVVQGDESFSISAVTLNGLTMIDTSSFTSLDQKSIVQRSILSVEEVHDLNSEFYSSHEFLLESVLTKDNMDFQAGFQQAVNFGRITVLQFLIQTINKDQSTSDNSEKLNILKEELLKAMNDSIFRRKYCNDLAVYIHNIGQEKLNLYLSGDAGEIQQRAYYTKSDKAYQMLSYYFQLASTLLDRNHPLYHKLLVKQYYFAGIYKRMQSLFDSLQQKTLLRDALILQKKAQAIDDKTPYIHHELGNIYSALGDYSHAKTNYLMAIELSPNWFLPYANLSSIYNLQDSVAKAIQYSEKSISLNPNYALAYLSLAMAQQKNGKLLSTLENFNHSIELDSNHFLPHFRFAMFNLELGKFELADLHFRKAEPGMEELQINSIFIQDPKVFNSGTEIQMSNDIAQSNQEFVDLEKQIKNNPKDVSAYFRLAKLFKKSLNYELAEVNFLKVLKLDSSFHEVYKEYGNLAMLKQDYQQAEFLLQKAVTKSEDDWITHLNLATIYEIWRDDENAEEQYKVAISKNLNHNLAYISLYNLYFRNRRYADAEKFLEHIAQVFNFDGNNALYEFYIKMSALFPSDGQWPYKIAQWILKPVSQPDFKILAFEEEEQSPKEIGFHNYSLDFRNDNDTSIKLLQKAIDLRTDYFDKVQIYLQMGKLAWHNRKWEEAENYFLQAMKFDTNLVSPLKILLENHQILNEYNKAYQWLMQLNHHQQLSLKEQRLLARYQIYNGDFKSAEQMLTAIMKKSAGDNQELYSLFALLFQRSKNYKKALDYLELIELTDINRANVQYTKARIYALQKNKKAALRWVEKSIESNFNYSKVLKYDPVWFALMSQKQWHKFLSDRNIELY